MPTYIAACIDEGAKAIPETLKERGQQLEQFWRRKHDSLPAWASVARVPSCNHLAQLQNEFSP
jgi:hypothetical protein